MSYDLPDEHYYANERTLMSYITLRGVNGIEVYFDGSGDSGQIDSVHVNYKDGGSYEREDTLLCWVRGGSEFNPGTRKWEQAESKQEKLTVEDFIYTHVDEALSRSGVDWYNGDGGSGEWKWDPIGGLDFSVNQRVTEYVTEHSEMRPLGRPEE